MFKLPKEADTWFQYIRSDLTMDFDMYYFCLMAGLAKGQKQVLGQNDTRDLIPRFPLEYRSQSKVIVSLFIKIELDKLGISLKDRPTVHEHIRRYLSTETQSNLSDEGEKEMNKYANQGIEVLKEHFGERPRTIESFFVQFPELIHELASQHIALTV